MLHHFRRFRKMPSKKWSCSELEKGAKGTLQIKAEAETEETLQERIKAGLTHVDIHV